VHYLAAIRWGSHPAFVETQISAVGINQFRDQQPVAVDKQHHRVVAQAELSEPCRLEQLVVHLGRCQEVALVYYPHSGSFDTSRIGEWALAKQVCLRARIADVPDFGQLGHSVQRYTRPQSKAGEIANLPGR